MSTGADPSAPLHRLTPNDRGPIIVIVAYSWIVVLSVIVLIRFGLAFSRRLRFKVDDGTFLFGAGLAISSSICFHLATNVGLGRRVSTVNQTELDQYYKMIYAGELLGIAAMSSAKVSVVLLSDRVAPQEPLSYYSILGTIAAWTVFSMAATAFQCFLPQPWVYQPLQCPSHGNLQYPIVIFNILTDGWLATWILPTLWKLLMDTGKRITVIALFGCRLGVCCTAVVQLSSIARHIRSKDVTYESFGRFLWGLCTIHLSVILATVPRTNRFIAALQSTHATTRLTAFELAHQDGAVRTLPKGSYSTSGALSTTLNDAQSRERSASPSRRSSRSREPLVDLPLKLTPSVNQQFSTQITSHVQMKVQEERRQANAKKYKDDDWRKYLRRSKNAEEDMNINSLFSWTSRTSFGERIIQTREVTQEVEVVPPRESRWTLSKPRRLNREK